MTREELERELYRRGKVVTTSAQQKCLTSMNGKQFVLIIDNINLVEG